MLANLLENFNKDFLEAVNKLGTETQFENGNGTYFHIKPMIFMNSIFLITGIKKDRFYRGNKITDRTLYNEKESVKTIDEFLKRNGVNNMKVSFINAL